MNNQNALLIFWIIFGFICITAIESIIFLTTRLALIIQALSGIPPSIMEFSMPISVVLIYLLSAYLIIKNVSANLDHDQSYLVLPSNKKFVSIFIIAIALKPLTYRGYSLFLEYSNWFENIDTALFLSISGWTQISVELSRWLILLFLGIISFRKLKAVKNNN